MACEGYSVRPHSPSRFSTALQFGDWGAVGFSGGDLRRRGLLISAHDSRTRAVPDRACRPERTVKSTLPTLRRDGVGSGRNGRRNDRSGDPPKGSSGWRITWILLICRRRVSALARSGSQRSRSPSESEILGHRLPAFGQPSFADRQDFEGCPSWTKTGNGVSKYVRASAPRHVFTW